MMLKKTDTRIAPWYIVRSDDKRTARLNTIAHLLSVIPHKKLSQKKVQLPNGRPRARMTMTRPSRAGGSCASATEMPTAAMALAITLSALLVFAGSGLALPDGSTAREPTGLQAGTTTKASLKPDDLDRLLAPVALYPDQLLAQMLLCAANPGKVGALNEWLASHQTLKGSELQDAATKSGFEPSFVALVLFPEVVSTMAEQLDWTTRLGQAFAADRTAVFASIQRLRAKASDAGKLKSTPQQEVETRTTSSGQQVIVIEPANPQVVYVPQYNPQVVYTHAPRRQVVSRR